MTEVARNILGFESQWWRARGNKEAAVREQFGMSAVRYAQVLNRIIDAPEAIEFDPILANRLRRIRSQRDAARAHRKAI
ncbi:DUF3263 domain-containing protein [Williamsia sp. R60]